MKGFQDKPLALEGLGLRRAWETLLSLVLSLLMFLQQVLHVHFTEMTRDAVDAHL